MGVCGSKKQGNFVSPAKNVHYVQIQHSLGSVLSNQVNINTLQINQQNYKKLQNTDVSQTIFMDRKDVFDGKVVDKDKICELMQNEYSWFFAAKIFQYENYVFSVVGKDYDHENRYVRIKRRYYQKFSNMSDMLSNLLSLKRLKIGGLTSYDEIRCFQKDQYYIIDRFFFIPSDILADTMQTYDYSNFLQTLVILEVISKTLKDLHSKSFAYRVLRPKNIYIQHGHLQKNHIQLASPNFIYSEKEQLFLDKFIEKKSDFKQYDCLTIGFLMMFLLDSEIQWEDFFDLDSEQGLQQIFSKINEQKVPQVLIATLKYILHYDKSRLLSMESLEKVFQSLIYKGPQTQFQYDSFGAFLAYHKKKVLKGIKPYIYLTRKNQIHFYDLETKNFNIIKLYRKKKKFNISSQLSYCKQEESFYFFANNFSQKTVKVQYLEKTGRSLLIFKTEVDFFKTLRGVNVEEPQIFVQENNSNSPLDIYLFNNARDIENNAENFYTSYIFRIKDENQYNSISEVEKDDTSNDQSYRGGHRQQNKNTIQIFEGPRKYQLHKSIYYFYDPHNQTFYGISDNQNIFENGIRYSSYDSQIQKGDFKDGVLRYACASSEQFDLFASLNFKLYTIDFCVEVQHGVFLMQASKNIFILDFNYKCFYSLASYQQISHYEKNRNKYPLQYQNAYEIRNQPFKIRFNFSNSKGRNVVFQQGFLYILGRYEIETVLCKYKILTEQAALILVSCKSMNSKEELLNNMPLPVNYIIRQQTLYQKEKQNNHEQSDQKFQIGNYQVKQMLVQKENVTIYKVIDSQNNPLTLRQFRLKKYDDYQYQLRALEKKVNDKYLVETQVCFLSQNIDNQQLFVNIVEEPEESDLEKEIKNRKKHKNYFKPKELAFIIKKLFKAIINLYSNDIKHGNIYPYQIYFLQSGFMKLAGWHQENKKKFESDFVDACAVIYSAVTLELLDTPLTKEKLQESEGYFEKYPGVYQFINQILQEKKLKHMKDLNKQIKKLYFILQRENLDINNLNSQNNNIYWIGYGSNYIITSNVVRYNDFGGNVFQTTEILTNDNSVYKFSKYNMFTYNQQTNIMYMVGAIKEELNQQEFYEIQFEQQEESVKIKGLEPVPGNILAPTLLYCNQQVYCIGGYEVFKNGSKTTTNKCFVYNIKKKKWNKIQNLPITVVNSTALVSQDNTLIYLFGGVSKEVDLTGRELNYFIYNINKNQWQLKVDLSIKSPFANSRFAKPVIDIVDQDLFVSYHLDQHYYYIEFFELNRGGIHLKYKLPLEKDKYLTEQNQNINIFTDVGMVKEYQKVLQDDLSMVVKQNTLYCLDEQKKDLIQISLDDIHSIKIKERVPCNVRRDYLEDGQFLDENAEEVLLYKQRYQKVDQ